MASHGPSSNSGEPWRPFCGSSYRLSLDDAPFDQVPAAIVLGEDVPDAFDGTIIVADESPGNEATGDDDPGEESENPFECAWQRARTSGEPLVLSVSAFRMSLFLTQLSGQHWPGGPWHPLKDQCDEWLLNAMFLISSQTMMTLDEHNSIMGAFMPLMQVLERRLEEATETAMMEEEGEQEELQEEPQDEDESPLEDEALLAKLRKLDE